jgi:hypothetical protein
LRAITRGLCLALGAHMTSFSRMKRAWCCTVIAQLTLTALVACSSNSGDGNDGSSGGKADDPDGSGPIVYLDQGLSADDRAHWLRDGLGNRVVPKSWFFALKDTTTGAMLADKANLGAIGFLYDDGEDVPMGLAENDGPGGPWLGGNCGGCHMQQIAYHGKRMRIVGGTNKLVLNDWFYKAFASIVNTSRDPVEADAFVTRLLGPAASDPNLKAQVRAALDQSAAQLGPIVDNWAAMHPIHDGPGRFATNEIIGNLAGGQLDPRNLRPERGYVGAPSVWGTDLQRWMHADGQNESRMARNAAGFSVTDAFFTDATGLTQVNWNPEDVHRDAHELTAKVQAPAWPEDILGRINRGAAARGEQIYDAKCAGCHTPDNDGQFLVNKLTDYRQIGTDRSYIEAQTDIDPATGARVERSLFTGALGAMFPDQNGQPRATVKMISEFLPMFSQTAENLRYAQLGITPAQAAQMEHGRSNQWRRTEAFMARPLTGVWTTAPYLHNDSVPNLYELLQPAAERSKTFRIGGEFDPKRVGYRSPGDQGYLFDTTTPSNDNGGHEGEDFGTTLSDGDRYDLIEYLKTL